MEVNCVDGPTEFPPSTSFFQPLPHKPFFKRHLLKENFERDTREIAYTVSTEFPPSSSFFLPPPQKFAFSKCRLKKAENVTSRIACTVFFKRHLLTLLMDEGLTGIGLLDASHVRTALPVFPYFPPSTSTYTTCRTQHVRSLCRTQVT
jgi:hypothetical protein